MPTHSIKTLVLGAQKKMTMRVLYILLHQVKTYVLTTMKYGCTSLTQFTMGP